VEIIETYPRNYKLFCKDCGEIRIINKEIYKKGIEHKCKLSEAFNTIKNTKDVDCIEVDLSQEINGTRMDIIHIEPIEVDKPLEEAKTEVIKKKKKRK